jgi:hypothetical protein
MHKELGNMSQPTGVDEQMANMTRSEALNRSLEDAKLFLSPALVTCQYCRWNLGVTRSLTPSTSHSIRHGV